MSWTGFKKGISRTGTKIMMKAGQVEKTVDRDFETEERRYKTLKTSADKLAKESKNFLDALRAMTAAQTRIANTIEHFYAEAGAKDNVATFYRQAIEDLDAQIVKELDTPYRHTVLDPIMRFSNYFTNIDQAITKRNHKLLDYDTCRAKVAKLTDKPAKDPTKLPAAEREMAVVKEVYEALNNQLCDELPQLIALRVPYFDPSFEALVNILIQFCNEGYERISMIQQYLDPSVRDDYSTGALDTKIEDILMTMKDLEICAATS